MRKKNIIFNAFFCSELFHRLQSSERLNSTTKCENVSKQSLSISELVLIRITKEFFLMRPPEKAVNMHHSNKAPDNDALFH